MSIIRIAGGFALAACCLWSQGFDPGCKLPFDALKTEGLDIDANCTIDGGAAPGDTGKKLESNAKNNFCAKGKPTTILYSAFTKLQGLSDQQDGLKAALKESRDVLADLLNLPSGRKVGEGTLVQYVGFLLSAHNSNVSKGELVNCKTKGKPANDIHIELVKTAGEEDECNGVTAEMSPHFRPESWGELVGMTIKRPVRVTGPLFFDGSHAPCHDNVRPKPNRISVWEIHPVYKFDVCKNTTLAACKAEADVWIPLDEWNSHAEEEAGGQ